MQKKHCLLRFGFAYLCLVSLVIEFFLFLSFPYTQSGFRIITMDSFYIVKEISKGSPSWEAGIRQGDHFVSINGVSVEQANAPRPARAVYDLYSTMYSFDTPIELVSTDGTAVTLYIPSNVSIWKKVMNICVNDLVTYVVGILFIILTILCLPYFPYTPDAGSCITFLDCAGICIANKLSYVANPVWFSYLNQFLYEISTCSLATSCLYSVRYFLRMSSASSRSIKVHSVLTFLPRIFFIICLITHLLNLENALSSTLFKYCEALMVISLLYMAIAFIWLLRHMTRQSSILLRFFLLALIFSILPLFTYQIQHLSANLEWVVESQAFYEAVPLLFAPVAVLCAFIQSKTFSFDQHSGRIMNIWCCFISELLILLFLNARLESSPGLLYALLILTPLAFVILENKLYDFLFPLIEKQDEKVQQLENSVYLATSIQPIFVQTSDWIKSVIRPSFIYFYRIRKGEQPLLLHRVHSMHKETDYEWMKYMMNDRLTHKKREKTIMHHSSYGVSVPLFRGNELFGYLFIGNRMVEEEYQIAEMYSTSEVRLLQKAARIMMDAVIMSDSRQVRKRSYELSESNDELAREIGTKERQILRMQDKMVLGLAVMVESRDNSTGGHIKRTCAAVHLFSDKLLEKPDCPKTRDWFDMVARAAILHDLGKIAVDDQILRKEGPFTPEEYEKMKLHTLEGARVVESVLEDVENEEFKQIAVNIAHYHHEKWDGSGYPEGLIGPEIPLEARIMAFADVFDALVSKRCYKDAFSFDKAYSIIENDLGSHFDPVLGKTFLECFPQLKAIYSVK